MFVFRQVLKRQQEETFFIKDHRTKTHILQSPKTLKSEQGLLHQKTANLDASSGGMVYWCLRCSKVEEEKDETGKCNKWDVSSHLHCSFPWQSGTVTRKRIQSKESWPKVLQQDHLCLFLVYFQTVRECQVYASWPNPRQEDRFWLFLESHLT